MCFVPQITEATGPSIKYVTLFSANFDPLPCHTLSHIPEHPQSTSHISTPPILSRPSTKNPDKSPLYKFSLNCLQGFLSGVLSGGLLSGRFCSGWFLPILPSVRKVNITLNFMFQMYDNIFL